MRYYLYQSWEKRENGIRRSRGYEASAGRNPRLAVELDVVVLEELTGGWPLAFVGNFGALYRNEVI